MKLTLEECKRRMDEVGKKMPGNIQWIRRH